MKRLQLLQFAAAGIAGCGLVLPTGVLAAQPGATPVAARTAEAPAIVDVVLNEGGTLHGQVVDAQGAPLAQTAVTLRSAGTVVASTTTNADGAFAASGLHGGLIEINAADGRSIVRVWTANASPPSANKAVLVVAGGPVARGQFFNGPNKLGSVALFGIIVGGVVGAGLISESTHSS